jgi:restriction system protein
MTAQNCPYRGFLMPIPDFQTISRPLLELMADGKDRSMSEVRDALAIQFALTPEERTDLLPSEKQARFDNRVAWSSSYLVRAGLLDRPSRGRIRIAQEGREALGVLKPGERVDLNFLKRYPAIESFRTGGGSASHVSDPIPVADATPEELIQSGYLQMRSMLAEQLRERTLACSPAFFERLVVDLLVAMGYGGTRRDAGQVVGGSGDGGIDGIIKEDKLGLDVVYLQAKRWKENVSRPTVQAFAGSLAMHRARKGVFITTSGFTQDAREYVTKIEMRIILLDGQELAELMIDHGIGVTDIQTYTLKRIDSDYFEEE